jgi:hypothetical protein
MCGEEYDIFVQTGMCKKCYINAMEEMASTEVKNSEIDKINKKLDDLSISFEILDLKIGKCLDRLGVLIKQSRK